MERDRVLKILREHQEELQAAGLLHLRLFGSVARGENTAESDVDLLADYDESRRVSLMTAVQWQTDLNRLLETEVHLTFSNSLKQAIRPHVLHEALDAF